MRIQKPNDENVSWIKDYDQSTSLQLSPTTTNEEAGYIMNRQLTEVAAWNTQRKCGKMFNLTAMKETQH